jgi:release factor glutamine methyltransferase
LKTYNDIYIEVKRKLKAAGITGCELEARLLLAFAADKSTEEFLRDIRLYPNRGYEDAALSLVERRLKGEPAAYIIGQWCFYGLNITVNPNVLIPRNDTEVVAETAIRQLKAMNKPNARVLDLCTGSGCIGLAIAANNAEARLTLVDNDERALITAKRNASLNGLSQRVSCVLGDALKSPAKILGRFSMIVCNPPYIPAEDIAALDISVKEHEPLAALNGGEDGLDFYRSVCSLWKQVLEPDAYLVFECGIGQSDSVISIGQSAGLKHIETVLDSGNIKRAVVLKNQVNITS